MRKMSDMDPNMILRYQHDEKNAAHRVILVGGEKIEIDIDPDQITQAIKDGLSNITIGSDPIKSDIQVIKVPEIIREVVVERIEVPVIVKELQVERIEVPIVTRVIEVIEKPIVIVETRIERIEVSGKDVEKLIKYIPPYIWVALGSLVTLVIVLGFKILKG